MTTPVLDATSVATNSAVGNPTSLTITTGSATSGIFALGIILLGQSAVVPSVTGVSTTGLSWAPRKAGGFLNGANLGNRNCDAELWEATTNAAFASATTTISVTNTQTCAAVIFLFNGVTGADANAAVPAFATGAGASGSVAATVNVSTSGAPDAIFGISGNCSDTTGATWVNGGSGFTDIVQVIAAGSQFCSIGAYYVITNSPQNNSAVSSLANPGSTLGDNWFILADALSGSGIPSMRRRVTPYYYTGT